MLKDLKSYACDAAERHKAVRGASPCTLVQHSFSQSCPQVDILTGVGLSKIESAGNALHKTKTICNTSIWFCNRFLSVILQSLFMLHVGI